MSAAYLMNAPHAPLTFAAARITYLLPHNNTCCSSRQDQSYTYGQIQDDVPHGFIIRAIVSAVRIYLIIRS